MVEDVLAVVEDVLAVAEELEDWEPLDEAEALVITSGGPAAQAWNRELASLIVVTPIMWGIGPSFSRFC